MFIQPLAGALSDQTRHRLAGDALILYGGVPSWPSSSGVAGNFGWAVGYLLLQADEL